MINFINKGASVLVNKELLNNDKYLQDFKRLYILRMTCNVICLLISLLIYKHQSLKTILVYEKNNLLIKSYIILLSILFIPNILLKIIELIFVILLLFLSTFFRKLKATFHYGILKINITPHNKIIYERF